MDIELYDKEVERLYAIKRRLDDIWKDLVESLHKLNEIGINGYDEVTECIRQIVNADHAVTGILTKMDRTVMNNFVAELKKALTEKGE